MLEVVGISKKFKNVKALEDINLTFGDKGLVALLGESGSGKSTLFNILTGIVKPDCGQVLYDGIILNQDGKINSQNVFGIIFQEGNLFEGLTVKENLSICSADEEKQKDILRRLGIKKYLNSDVRKLSGGEAQRVAIARALLDESKVLLADEPTGALDEKNGKNVMRLLKEISEDKLVIVITHNVEFAECYADRIIKIYKGKIQEDRQNSHSDVSIDKSMQANKEGFVAQTDNGNNSQGKLSFSALNKLCFNKIKNSFSKSISSIIIFTVLLALIAVSSAFLMTDCRNEYLQSLEKYEYTQLYNEHDMIVFKEKTQEGDLSGLTRYYYNGWSYGLCDKIIIDDTLADNEIKLGFFATQVVNSQYNMNYQIGDSIDYNGRQFIIAEFVEHIESSDKLNVDKAVYLNDKTAREIILTKDVRVRFEGVTEIVNVLCDSTLEDGVCIINFNIYYDISKDNPQYIDLANPIIEWHINNYNTSLYRKKFVIKSVKYDIQDLSNYTLYVSPNDYEEISNSRLIYGYMLKPSDKATIEYWWNRGVDIFDEGYEDYIKAQNIKQIATPYIWAVFVIGVVLSMLYMFVILNHIVVTNLRELYILKTLRIGNTSIFGILSLQALPLVLFANIFALILNIIARVSIKSSLIFIVLEVLLSNIILFAISLVITIVITLIKLFILNKNFNINMTR